jgi:purine-nucleoside phosphorylase
MSLFDAASRAADAVQAQVSHQPRLGLVLGSGLGRLGEQIESPTALPYAAIPGLAPTSVGSHAGRLVLGWLEGQPVAVLQGRVHLYEGHAAGQVVLPLLLLWRLGIDGIILTNAAGGINPAFGEGALMAISDHINLTGHNPLIGPEEPRLTPPGGRGSPRFVDMTDAYDPAWRALAHRVATAAGITLHEGVYLGLTGPSFETPAEIRMAARLGADAVGMSTVLETIAARAAGLRVLGLSCITNLAAGLGGPISHEEVGVVAARVAGQFETLVRGVVGRYDEAIST